MISNIRVRALGGSLRTVPVGIIIINCMNEKSLRECGLVPTEEQELQMSGGVTWDEILNLVTFIERILNYVEDYKDDALRGFKKGWRML